MDGAPTDDLQRWESDVVLRDGGTVHLRPMHTADGEQLLALHSRLSDESLYSRFFSLVRAPTPHDLDQLTDLDYDRRFALVAELGNDIIAVARYARMQDEDAEVAFTVQDDQQGRGLATVMLEHLAAVAYERGVRRFVAVTMADNTRMLGVFADAGFETHRSFDGGTVDVTFDIDPTASSVDAQRARERISEARSVTRLLAPSSIAVVGASRRRGTIGNGVLRNLLASDFQGPVHPVNREATSVAGVQCYPSVDAIPGPVDLAVVCVPAEHVLQVAEDCVRKGVHGLVVVSAGFAEVSDDHGSAERALVELVRRNGMRLIGPNCMGVVNTNPGVGMNATFAPFAPHPGRVGFASQSGGLGIELLARSRELDLGISTFVSMGNKADVSSNDLIQYWDEDPDTDVILLYLESFGNPRKFARLARRVARRKPIIAVKSGRTPAGERGASSHTASLASPDVAVDALFRQAGVVRVDTLEQLFDTARVMLHQPLPRGRRVAIVSNGGGPGILAADACVAAGLEVAELSEATQAALRTFVSPDAGVRNPVDLVASATAETYARTLDVLIADPEVDALLVIFVPPMVTRAEDVAAAVGAAQGRDSDKTLLACFLGRNGTIEVPEVPASRAAPSRRVPTFAFPESAAAALGRVAGHVEWCERPEGSVPTFADAHIDAVRVLVADRLARSPDGAWLDADDAAQILDALGIPLARVVRVETADAAATAATDLGMPVALKAGSPTILHKTERGAVRLGLADDAAVRGAFDDMRARLGDEMEGQSSSRWCPPAWRPSWGSLATRRSVHSCSSAWVASRPS